MHKYEVRPAKGDGVMLLSEELPFGRLWYGGANAVENAIGYARFFSRTAETEVKVFGAKGEVVAEHRWDARTKRDLVI